MAEFEQFNDYQHRALSTAAVQQKSRAGKAWAGLEFGSEILELSALIMGTVTKSQFRPRGKEHAHFLNKLKDELGDTLWAIAVLAGKYELNLADLATANLEKVGQKHGKPEVGNETRSGPVERPVAVSKPDEAFPWLKGNKKAITACPKCHTATVFKEGCVSCPAPDCGWSAC